MDIVLYTFVCVAVVYGAGTTYFYERMGKREDLVDLFQQAPVQTRWMVLKEAASWPKKMLWKDTG